MNELKAFRNEQFGQLRVVEKDGELWFVAGDIAKALGYRDAEKMTRRLDNDEKDTRLVGTPGGEQQMTIINEAGMYNAIIGSKIPEAKAFKRWVTHEVLPSIRKTGGYIAAAPDDTPEEIMARALIVANETLERQKRQLEAAETELTEARPKALFADAVSASSTSILVGDLAKLLKQNGHETGAKRLFARLRDEGFLIKRKGSDWNMPTQRSMEQGLFDVKETAITHSDGHVSIKKTTKVTGKGQVYFVNRYCGDNL